MYKVKNGFMSARDITEIFNNVPKRCNQSDADF